MDVGWGFVFPSALSDEFIGIFTAPASFGWMGTSLGGSMRDSLLLVGWMNGATPIVSPRYTT